MNKAAPLLLLLALVAGGGVGYLLGSNSATDGTRVERSEEPTYEPPAIERDPEQPRTGLTRALDDLPVPKFARGNGTITGTIKTDDGKPLRGVLVRATQRRTRGSKPYQRGAGPPRQRTLEETVLQTVKHYHRQRGATREGVSGSDGSYQVKGVVVGEKYSVQCYLEDYDVRAAPGSQPYDAVSGASIDYIARRVASLPVDVVLPDGSRPERVSIRRKHGNSTDSDTWMPGYPVLRVHPGNYTVWAEMDGNSDYTSDKVEVEVFADKATPQIVIHMRSQPGIRGTIKLPVGAKVQYMQTYAAEMEPNEKPPLDRLKKGKSAYTHNGQFHLKDLEPGTYLVGVLLGNRAVVASRTVTVTDHMVTCNFEITEFNPAEFVRMKVFGPDGKPVPGVRFTTAFRTQSGSSSGGGFAVIMKDHYLVAHHEGDDPDGKHYVTATSKKFGSRELEYDRAKTRELEIHFQEPAKLKVTINGYTGSSAAGQLALRIRRKGSHRFSNTSQEGVPKRDGTLVMGPVEPGECELVLLIKVDTHSRLTASKTPLNLRPGDNTVQVETPRLYTLTILLPNGKGQVQLQPQPRGEGWFYAHANVGKDKRAVFKNLVAGQYKVSNGSDQMIVTVRGTQTVTFAAQVINALHVYVTDANGAFAKAGFVNDDLVIGMDGVEFKNRTHLSSLFSAARGSEDSTLMILRGGKRVDLTIDVKTLRGGGGRIEATSR